MISKCSLNFERSSDCHWYWRLAGHDDEHSLDDPPGPQLLEDQPGLDGLSEADLVSEDHPRLQLVGDAVGDEHLVQVRLDAGVRQSRTRVEAVGVLEVERRAVADSNASRLADLPRAQRFLGRIRNADQVVDVDELVAVGEHHCHVTTVDSLHDATPA